MKGDLRGVSRVASPDGTGRILGQVLSDRHTWLYRVRLEDGRIRHYTLSELAAAPVRTCWRARGRR